MSDAMADRSAATPRPRITVFVGMSLDGYIADDNGNLEWLEAAAAADGEDYGFARLVASVDAVAMGRGTWDHIAHLDDLPYQGVPIYVFTHRPPEAHRPGVTFWSPTPTEAVDAWQQAGITHVYLDGGVTVSSFLAQGLVDDLVLTVVPMLLGSGRPLFHRHPQSTDLDLVDVDRHPNGVVSMRYRRRR